MTPQDIINLVIEQVVLPPGEWENVLRKVDNMLALEWEIHLGTELTEA